MGYKRRLSSVANIGNTPLGGSFPIRVQSMANVSTMDTDAAVEQAIRMIDAGAEYVRFTAQGEREARNLGVIRSILNEKGYRTPLVADIHFNPKAADVAACFVEKVRINPGNYVDKVKTFSHLEYTGEEYAAELEKIRARLVPFLRICREHGTAVRLGVNHGSLSDRIMSRYGDTPEGLVESCMEFLRICRDEEFNDVVISIKASNTGVMVRAVRLLVRTMDAEDMHYPLHLGVTEAGEGEDGRIKSAVGIGTLLAEGIGDTIRVSLSEAPEAEIPVARKLVAYFSSWEKAAKDGAGYPGTENGMLPPGGMAYTVSGTPLFGFPPVLFLSEDRKSATAVSPEGKTEGTYPYFRLSEMEECLAADGGVKLLELGCKDLDAATLEKLRGAVSLALVITTERIDGLYEQRAAFRRLAEAGVHLPVIIRRDYDDTVVEDVRLKASVDMGALLIDGFGNGLMLSAPNSPETETRRTAFGILQATRARISKTEYISCPSCGRTLYDLQATIARVKAATSHLTGLKIGIMGCIVNGPGEMADADYGYVGAGVGRISLYKGKECVLRNIPEAEAVEKLVALIKENGDWREKGAKTQ